MILLELAKLLGLVPPPLIDTFFSQIRARALIEAQKVQLFDLLAAGPLTAEEIARQVKYDTDGTRTLLEVLVIIGYLRRVGQGRYRNSSWARRWLVRSNPDCLGNIVMHAQTVWERAPYIQQVLQSGKAPFDFHHKATPEQHHHYMLANRDMARRVMPEFVRVVKLPPTASKLIDLGGAHGEFAAGLVAANPALEATVFDLPVAIAAGRELASQDDNLRRLTFQEGDFFEDDFGSAWDVALLNHVTRVFSREKNQILFHRVFDRLSSRGVLVITDQLLGFGRTHDMYGKLFSFNLFPVGGRCYDVREIESMLKAVGFQGITRKKLKTAIGSVIVIAGKP
jgi:hypothetical protein